LFYAANYIGSKTSALYAFYLTASKVPLGFSEKLTWEDVFPLNSVIGGFVRYVSELLLHFTDSISVKAKYRWSKNENNNPELLSELHITGKGLFSFFKKESYGKVELNPEQGIEEFYITFNNKVFHAKKGEVKNEASS
jgi:hypothetical protein